MISVSKVTCLRLCCSKPKFVHASALLRSVEETGSGSSTSVLCLAAFCHMETSRLCLSLTMRTMPGLNSDSLSFHLLFSLCSVVPRRRVFSFLQHRNLQDQPCPHILEAALAFPFFPQAKCRNFCTR